MASILTGRYPSEHGLHCHTRHIKAPGMARLFQEEGFFTAAVVNNNNLEAAFGFADGFDQYHYFPNEDHDAVFQVAPRLIESAGDSRFFCVIHTNIAHDYGMDRPYYRDPDDREPVPPVSHKPWMSWPDEYHDVLRNRYRRGIRYCIERLRSEILPLFKLDETLVLITSDHGEGLYSPRIYHAGRLHNDLLHVPAVILNETGVEPDLMSQLALWDAAGERLSMPVRGRHNGRIGAEDFGYIYRHDLPAGKNRVDYVSSPGLSLQCWFDGSFKTIVANSPVDGYSHVERYNIQADWPEAINIAAAGAGVANFPRPHPPIGSEAMRAHAENLLACSGEYMAEGKWRAAGEVLDCIADVFLDYVPAQRGTVLLRRGLCREATGDLLGAIREFRAAVADGSGIRPLDSVLAEYRTAVCQIQMGQQTAAVARLANLIPVLEGQIDQSARDLHRDILLMLANIGEHAGCDAGTFTPETAIPKETGDRSRDQESAKSAV